MADLNRVFLIGRLTRDPELRYTPSGTPVSDLRIATTRSYRPSGGDDSERREEVLYVDVTVWNRTAENCCQYLTKGSSIHVEGHLKMDTWEDKNTGEKRSKVGVVADAVQFLDTRRREDSAPRDPESSHSAPRSPEGPRRPANGGTQPAPRPSRQPEAAPPAGAGDDDIPF